MNLLKRRIKNSNILEFRKFQYELIPSMIDICFDYLESFDMKLRSDKMSIEYETSVQYISQRNYDTQLIKIKLDKDKPNYFLQLNIPNLLDDMFFRLNGAMYIPTIYCTDSPIVFKEKSIKLSSLFKSITIFFNNNRVIFLGVNIPIFRFFRIFYSESETKEILSFLGVTNILVESQESVINDISKILKIEPNLENIKKIINKLFFDNWTNELYKKYYNIKNIDLKDILDKMIELKKENKSSFINLNYKRLVFIEYLLDPLFKAVSASSSLLLENKNVTKINIGIGDIIKFFFTSKGGDLNKKGLEKSNFYDVVNGFSGLLSTKASFKNPRGNNSYPTEVSSIHPTYKNKICPVTVSNQQSGVVNSLVPQQNVDLKYGIFLE